MKLVKKHYSRESPLVCNANGRDLSEQLVQSEHEIFLNSFLWFPLFQNLSFKNITQNVNYIYSIIHND